MELQQLRYLCAIAERGSLSAAARSLGVRQPTLTVAMRHLEEELRVTLFNRNHSGVSLTEAGHALRAHAKEVLARIELAAQQVRHLEDDDVGQFTLGCHESLGAYFLPSFLPGFLALHPRIDVFLWNGPSASVRDAVLAREIHLGLAVNPAPHPDLVLVKLFRDAYDLHVATAGAPKTEAHAHARLREGPLVHAERVFQSHELVDRLASAGLLPEKQLRCGDLELVKSLAMAGIGVAMLPRRVAAYHAEGKLRRLHASLPYIADTIHLLYRVDMHRTRAANRLKDALVTHGRTLDASYEE